MAIIRQATILDIPNLAELNKECLPIYYDYFQHLTFIMSSSNLVLVVEHNNLIIGYLIGEYNYNNTNNFHILSIGVLEKYRSKGIGKKLIDNININNITLYVHTLNEKGINFYKRNGFTITKLLKDYYKGMFDSLSHDAYLLNYKNTNQSNNNRD